MRTRSLNAYLLLAGIFLGALVVCNLIVGKFFGFQWPVIGGPAILSVGILPYPLTFLVTDILSEVYGRRRANVVVWVGFVVSLLTLVYLSLGAAVPAIESSRVDDATYDLVFGSAPRAILASMTAYLFAQWFDIQVFHFWKRLTKGRFLWFRNNASTVVSQLLDSTLVVTLLFAGEWPASQILIAIGSGWLFKALCALADTPLIYLAVWAFRRYDLAPEDSEYYRGRRADDAQS